MRSISDLCAKDITVSDRLFKLLVSFNKYKVGIALNPLKYHKSTINKIEKNKLRIIRNQRCALFLNKKEIDAKIKIKNKYMYTCEICLYDISI